MQIKKIMASVVAGVIAVSTLATAAFATETVATEVTRTWEQWDLKATSGISFSRSLNNVTEQRGLANTLFIADSVASTTDVAGVADFHGPYAVYVTKAELTPIINALKTVTGAGTVFSISINGVAPFELDSNGVATDLGTGTGYAVILDEDGTLTDGEIATADTITITLTPEDGTPATYNDIKTAITTAVNTGLDFDFAIGAKKGDAAQVYPAHFAAAANVANAPFTNLYAVTYVQGNIIAANQTAATELTYAGSAEGLLSTLEAYSFINGASGKLAINFAAAQTAIGKVSAYVEINGKEVALDTAICDEGATSAEFAIPADALGLYIKDAAVQFWTIATAYGLTNKTGQAIKDAVLTVTPAEETILDEIVVEVPAEEPGDNTDTDTVDDAPAADTETNAPTGVALAVIPALVAGAAVVASRKRK